MRYHLSQWKGSLVNVFGALVSWLDGLTKDANVKVDQINQVVKENYKLKNKTDALQKRINKGE